MNVFEMLPIDCACEKPIQMLPGVELALDLSQLPTETPVDSCPHSPFCGAYFEQGCLADPLHWIPVSSVFECPKIETWGCLGCDRSRDGWCLDGDTWRNIEVLSSCPKRPPSPEPEEPPWDYDEYCKERDCYGCNFFEAHSGSYLCRYDMQERTRERNLVCPVAFAYGFRPVSVEGT
ncbi:MAG: hypothetical protein AB1646_21885 [Thermodesulfobacteriota bacterium]